MNAAQIVDGLSNPPLKPAIPAQELNFFSDPGHGWLEVPVALIKRLNIAGLISAYSYVSHDKQTAYLEEDCDAGTLMQALKEHGVSVKIKELSPAGAQSFIRRLPRFCA